MTGTNQRDGPDTERGVESPDLPRSQRFVDREGEAWTIRPVADGDRDALIELYDDFDPADRAQGVPPLKRPRIETWVDDLLSEGRNFVVDAGDRLVGHALYTPAGDAEPEFAVFVHGTYRERGIGTAVSKRAIAAATAADREALSLVVEPDNRAARRLYDRLGFEIVEQATYERAGRRRGALRMRRPLSDADAIDLQRRPPAENRVASDREG